VKARSLRFSFVIVCLFVAAGLGIEATASVTGTPARSGPENSNASWVVVKTFPTAPQAGTPSVSCAGFGCLDMGADGSVQRASDAERPPYSSTLLGAPPHELACTSFTHCIRIAAVGGLGDALVEYTDDAGRVWQHSKIPAVGEGASGVACNTRQWCWVVGAAIEISKDGGAVWTSESMPMLPGRIMLTTVTCPTARICIAVGTQGVNGPAVAITTTDAGTHWEVSDHTSLQGVSVGGTAVGEGLLDVTCPTRTHCVAVGYVGQADGLVLVSSDSGQSWHQIPLLSVVAGLNAISCVSALRCVAVGDARFTTQLDQYGAAVSTDNGGATWSPLVLPSEVGALDQVWCENGADCIASGAVDSLNQGGATIVSQDAGARWRNISPAPQIISLDAIACASAVLCAAVGQTQYGNALLSSSDLGSSWSIQTTSAPVEELACSSSECLAATDEPPSDPNTLWRLRQGSRVWSPRSIGLAVRTLSCHGSLCVAEDSEGFSGGKVAVSTDGGQYWTIKTLASKWQFSYVSCPTSLHCVAVGDIQAAAASPGFVSAAFISSNGGQSWTMSTELGALTGSLNALACPTEQLCFVDAGNYVERSDDGGRTWKTVFVAEPISSTFFVACVAERDCLLTEGYQGAAVYATSNGGSSWTKQHTPTLVNDFMGVACPSAHQCVAIGRRQGSFAALVARGSIVAP
jgi:hypothetical protein